jgi:hypothetical protein
MQVMATGQGWAVRVVRADQVAWKGQVALAVPAPWVAPVVRGGPILLPIHPADRAGLGEWAIQRVLSDRPCRPF